MGLTQTMVENIDNPSDGGIGTGVDVISFLTSWLGNSTEITQLRVIISDDGHMVIEYGSPIEQNYSGKHISLNTAIIDKYYNYSPSIIFSAGDKADEWIRSWFGLTGAGKYTMDLEFGKVYISDCGYKLIFEDGELYQVPIIHEGTVMNIYYTENGETKLVLDAAEILKKTRIKVPEEEAEKIICQLRDAGIIS